MISTTAHIPIQNPRAGLYVSMFQIPEPSRTGLLQVSAQSVMTGPKKSINSCILEALDYYLSLPVEQQAEPKLPKLPLRHYTVRMSDEMKQQLAKTAASWQIKRGIPTTMNAVVNTSILVYLQNQIPGFELPI